MLLYENFLQCHWYPLAAHFIFWLSQIPLQCPGIAFPKESSIGDSHLVLIAILSHGCQFLTLKLGKCGLGKDLALCS